MDDLWVVLPHLGAGGAQKVGLLAAEHFAEPYTKRERIILHTVLTSNDRSSISKVAFM